MKKEKIIPLLTTGVFSDSTACCETRVRINNQGVSMVEHNYCSVHSSAPELLEACKDVLREKTLHGNVVDSIRAVRKAIDKAEGREA